MKMSSPIVQYVLVRGDLMKTLKWPLGAVIAQACHACTAVMHMFCEDPVVKEYLKDLNSMHKVVLEVPDENSLVELSKVLKEKEVLHKLWVEQPENFPTCLVVKSYRKEEIQMYFKKFKLMK